MSYKKVTGDQILEVVVKGGPTVIICKNPCLMYKDGREIIKLIQVRIKAMGIPSNLMTYLCQNVILLY